MNINQLQYQTIVNRRTLADLYEYKQMFKDCKRQADGEGDLEWEYDSHNELKKVSKQIAKLVDLQKALKTTIRSHSKFKKEAAKYRKAAEQRRAMFAEKDE